jgi:hypothetical protein
MYLVVKVGLLDQKLGIGLNEGREGAPLMRPKTPQLPKLALVLVRLRNHLQRSQPGNGFSISGSCIPS